jgi:FkbM family methyltransferase
MKQNISRFIEIQQNRGTSHALSSAKSYFKRQIGVDGLKNRYWDLKQGTQRLSIGNIQAEFDATTDRGGNRIRWLYDTEEQFLNDITNDLHDDDVFFDVGANIGIISCFAASCITQGHIVAFEPYPPNVPQLKRNLQYNADESDYDILEVALSNSHGSINFTAPDDDLGNGTGNISPTGDSIGVKSVTGDELVDGGSIPSPTVVKIDVEGAESLVIGGLEDSLNNSSCRILYCELHLPRDDGGRPSFEDYAESQESILRKISELGFDIVYSETRGSEVHVKAAK